MTPLQRLQDLFRELFQLDLADLDFGIYRLLHLKRDEVEAFLTEQLPRRVWEAFVGMAEGEKAALERSVAELQAPRFRAGRAHGAAFTARRKREAVLGTPEGILADAPRFGGLCPYRGVRAPKPERDYPLLRQDDDGAYISKVLAV